MPKQAQFTSVTRISLFLFTQSSTPPLPLLQNDQALPQETNLTLRFNSTDAMPTSIPQQTTQKSPRNELPFPTNLKNAFLLKQIRDFRMRVRRVGRILPVIENGARAGVDSRSNLWIEMGGSRARMKNCSRVEG